MAAITDNCKTEFVQIILYLSINKEYLHFDFETKIDKQSLYEYLTKYNIQEIIKYKI